MQHSAEPGSTEHKLLRDQRRAAFFDCICRYNAAGGSAYGQNPVSGRLRAGAAKADITPKESDLVIATDSIRDHLFVRVIVVDDGSACAVLVGIDLGGASGQIVDDASARASKATGCPVQNFIISATHTHSSNTLGLGGRGAPTAKTAADAIVATATMAKSKLAPARIGCR